LQQSVAYEMASIFNDLVALQTAAKLLGVHRGTMYRMMQKGVAPPHEMIEGKPFFYASRIHEITDGRKEDSSRGK
jgi:excisionase family DNA binding protein